MSTTLHTIYADDNDDGNDNHSNNNNMPNNKPGILIATKIEIKIFYK
jgi:hypothetical protein